MRRYIVYWFPKHVGDLGEDYWDFVRDIGSGNYRSKEQALHIAKSYVKRNGGYAEVWVIIDDDAYEEVESVASQGMRGSADHYV